LRLPRQVRGRRQKLIVADLKRVSRRLQIWTLYLLAASLFLAPGAVSAALALTWIGFVLALEGQRDLPRHATVWLAAAFAIYCLARAALAHFGAAGPGAAWSAALDWIQLLVFVPVAYALRGDQRLLLRLLLLAVIGLLLGMMWRLDWNLLLADPLGLLGSRPGFGFPTIAYALYSGTALLGLILLRERFWHGASDRATVPRITLWLLLLLLLAEGFLITQSRGAWLALAMTGAIGIFSAWRGPLQMPDSRSRVTAVVLTVAALLLVITANAPRITDRLAAEADVARALAEGEVDYRQESSLSLRWHAQVFGLRQWLVRPWLGWGPGASRPLMQASGDPALRDVDGSVLRHLHNTYLEVLVQLGVVGLALLGGLYLMLIAGLRRAIRRGSLVTDLGSFLILALVFGAVWALFSFRALHQDWRAYWALLGGAALSFALYPKVAAGDREQ
jgi:O-antigen ligase